MKQTKSLNIERGKDEEEGRVGVHRKQPSELEGTRETSSHKATRKGGAIHQGMTRTLCTTSQMRNEKVDGHDNSSHNRKSNKCNAPESIQDKVPASLRATRSSNRVNKRPPVSYEEKSPSLKKFSKKHGLGTPWDHPAYFPPTGRPQASVRFDDLPKLDEGECLNDSLIEFYMTYCHEEAKREKRVLPDSVYIFNSFFYTSLTQTRNSKDKINYDAVARWTRKVDLFTYEYVVIPINEE
ncbi:cysteine proteinase [Pseudovirgaria hyperparasitica]|uniref:Cysteine proteinase n=1 Tax=Pseudovirgaria hyperparasitica TaxID=470096 RepID=A0A6A6VYA1_9PEZI|nr:cysteine proteinase [Pseudovirgaria hyperparasitica]KAF2754796.1 cysteine proteinase [Pseudovirgaria hyperparasitica]